MDSLDDDFNEKETREFITDSLKAKGWKLKSNMPCVVEAKHAAQ